MSLDRKADETNLRQKIERIEVLGSINLGLISPLARDMPHIDGKLFYASVNGAELGGNGILTSAAGHGRTVEEAIDDLWSALTTYDDDKRYVIVGAYKEGRSAFRWKEGIGWTTVNESVEHAAWDKLVRNN